MTNTVIAFHNGRGVTANDIKAMMQRLDFVPRSSLNKPEIIGFVDGDFVTMAVDEKVFKAEMGIKSNARLNPR